MANKPGACDLRCNEAVLSAMLAHPRHGRREDFLAWGAEMVRSGNWAFARHLPPTDARRALEADRERIARRQSNSGLWFRKHAEEWSYPILVALDHAGVLREWIVSGTLRCDPLAPFAERRDAWGLLVRRNVAHVEISGDRELRARVVAEIVGRQAPDGSWDGSVAATALEVERLLALGELAHAPALARAGRWILDQHRATLELPRRAGRQITARDLFTAHHVAEFRGAQERFPQMKIARSCFMNVPIIQTALALRALVALGFADDPRVAKAYESLLDLQVQPGEKPSGTACRAGLFGNWCAHRICFRLEDRLRAEKSAR